MIFYSRKSWNSIFFGRQHFGQKFLEYSRIFQNWRKIGIWGWERQDGNIGLPPKRVRVIFRIFIWKKIFYVRRHRKNYSADFRPADRNFGHIPQLVGRENAKKSIFLNFFNFLSRYFQILIPGAKHFQNISGTHFRPYIIIPANIGHSIEI